MGAAEARAFRRGAIAGGRPVSASRRPRNRLAVAATLAALGVLAGCGGDAPGTPPAPEVTVVTLAAETVTLTRELPGRVSPFLIAEVRPQVSGIVHKRLLRPRAGSSRPASSLYRAGRLRPIARTPRARVPSFARAEATLVAARATASAHRRARAISTRSAARTTTTAVAALGEAEADVGAARAALARAEVDARLCAHRLADQPGASASRR